jgi:renalase
VRAVRAEEHADVLVLGAGIAGLSCASALTRAGRRVLVLEKARGVGGRAATRRLDGQPVDHGVAFIHTEDPELLAHLEAAAAAHGPDELIDWPLRVEGAGQPCLPRAFAGRERRLALRGGLTVLAKHLSAGLQLRLGQRAEGLRPGQIDCDNGLFHAPDLVITAPLPQALELLRGLPPRPELHSALELLRAATVHPCITVIATYPADRPAPAWDICYPEAGPLALIAHDSRKRAAPRCHALVLQASPRWSREHLEGDPARWSADLLAAAAPYLPHQLGAPQGLQSHRWRYARLDGASQLAEPLLIDLGDGQRLGLAGEAFAWSGGVEAAFHSGRRLAQRLLVGPHKRDL